jgi:hypothetical protein
LPIVFLETPASPCFTSKRKSWHGICFIYGTTTITSAEPHNKNKTYRLQHNKNKTAEAQLTDSFGEELPLGLAPQPDREQ